MLLPIERLAIVPLTIGLAVLTWDILLAGWIASQRQASQPFTALTGFCGLLVAPAALVAIASTLEGTARTVVGIAWVWPLITVCFAVQVGHALFARLLTPAVAVPLLLYNCGAATVAISDYLVAVTGSAPLWLQGAVAARDAIAGLAAGRAALASPLFLLVPIIAPAYPARWRASALVRALLTLSATALATLLVVEWPPAVGAIRSYDAALGVRMQERPANDFSIGLRMFSRLDRAPANRLVKADVKLAELLGSRTVLVVISEEGARPAALDSLARVLDPWRSDSGSIAVGLQFSSRSPAPGTAAQDVLLTNVLQRVRPDVIIPGWRTPLPSVLPAHEPDAAWWEAMLTQAGAVVTRVRPRTVIAFSAARVDDVDSAVYNWASQPGSPVKILGVVAYPSFAGLPAVDARLRAFDRWHALATTQYGTTRDHWIMETGGLPRAHGDAAQTASVMHTLAWASRRDWVTVAIIGDAGDYDTATGLRAANGRLRNVVDVVSRAARGMREAAIGAR